MKRILSIRCLPNTLRSTWCHLSNAARSHVNLVVSVASVQSSWMWWWSLHHGSDRGQEYSSQLLLACGLRFLLHKMQNFRGNRTFWKFLLVFLLVCIFSHIAVSKLSFFFLLPVDYLNISQQSPFRIDFVFVMSICPFLKPSHLLSFNVLLANQIVSVLFY